jgi:uncharacterized protein YebE (UPF0316 family)
MKLKYFLKALHHQFLLCKMKRLIITSGIAFLSINIIAFGVTSSLKTYSFIASEFSILTSFIFIFSVTQSRIDNAFKIFLVLALAFSFAGKYILSIYFSGVVTNSYSFLSLVVITSMEIIGFSIFKYASQHS